MSHRYIARPFKGKTLCLGNFFLGMNGIKKPTMKIHIKWNLIQASIKLMTLFS